MTVKQEHELLSQNEPPRSAPTAQQLFYRVKEEILATAGSGYLEYHISNPGIGWQVARSLDCDGQVERRSVRLSYDSVAYILSVRMPTEFHNAHLAWAHREFALSVSGGFFTLQEYDTFICTSDTSFDSFLPPYQNSFKQPDGYFKLAGAPCPTVVFETGYSESYPQLVADRNLWINGTTGVNVVILLKWSLVRNRTAVKGYIEGWHRNMPTCQRFDIFPAPPPGTPAQTITLYRRDFYLPGAVPWGRNPNDVWRWSIDSLRLKAAQTIRDSGYVPA
ncbi:hypothetical protein DTO195F2_9225 [Paecilomyces variotii]|nr:hypothetical protein DTO195F2_9225 [Paecilomyces variotii]KAJ9300500.1 hypothetical protein DTO217A2_7874 [Paecilomyces variotii]KAJ9366926.1 hypothetical protein DTO282E5_8419 [Paecilomyces variotii]